MLRSARLLRADPALRITEAELIRQTFQPCGEFNRRSGGFVSPLPESGLIHPIGDWQLMCYQSAERLLPASVIREAVQAKADKWERDTGYKPGRKLLQKMADEVEVAMLPRAFVHHKRTFLALGDGFLIIDASSKTRADDVMGALKLALGELPFLMPRTKLPATVGMGSWLASGEAAAPFSIDRAARIASRAEEQGRISYARINLDNDEIRNRIASGYQVEALELTHNDRISFVLHDDMRLTRITLLDVLIDGSDEPSDDISAFEGQWLLALEEVRASLHSLYRALGGAAEQDDLLGKAYK